MDGHLGWEGDAGDQDEDVSTEADTADGEDEARTDGGTVGRRHSPRAHLA